MKKVNVCNTRGVLFNIVPNQAGAVLDILMKDYNLYSFRTRDNAPFLPSPRDISSVRHGVVICNRFGFMITEKPIDFVDQNHAYYMDDNEMILNKEDKRMVAGSFNRTPISLLNVHDLMNALKSF